MFLVLARRSLTVYAALFGGAISLFDMWMNRSLDGNWQQSVQDATFTLVLSLPGLVLAAGLDGCRYLADRHTRLVAGVRPWRCLVTAMAASALWPGLAMVTLLLTTFAVNASMGPYFDPGVLTVVLPFVFVMGFTALAFLLGRYLAVAALVPLAPILGYLAPVLMSRTPDVPLALLSPIDVVPSDPPFVLQSKVVLAQIVIGLAIVAGVVSLLVLGGRVGPRVPWAQCLVGAATIGAIVGILSLVDPARHVWVTDADGPRTCRTSATLHVCAWAQHARLLPPIENVGNAMLAAIGHDWDGRPAGVIEDGLKVPRGWLRFGTGTRSISQGDAAYTLAASLVAFLFCGQDDRQPDVSADVTDREQWLLVSTGYLPVGYASERVLRIHERPLVRQQAWWVDVRQGSVACGTL
jgi:hypothetical protein